MATTITFAFGANYDYDKNDYDVILREANDNESRLLENSNRGYLAVPDASKKQRIIIFSKYNIALSEYNSHKNSLKIQNKLKAIKNQKIHTVEQLKKYLSSDFSQAFDLFNKGIRFTADIATRNKMTLVREHIIDEEERDHGREMASFFYEMTDEEKKKFVNYCKKQDNNRTRYQKMISELVGNYHDKHNRSIDRYARPFKFFIDNENTNHVDCLLPQNDSSFGIFNHDKHECKIINISEIQKNATIYLNRNIISFEPILAVDRKILVNISKGLNHQQ